jgi:hypothetical protein
MSHDKRIDRRIVNSSSSPTRQLLEPHMDPYDPRYLPMLTHIEDLEREAATAHLNALAAPRRSPWALIRSALRHLHPTQTETD